MQTFADWVQFSVASAVVLLLLALVILVIVLIARRSRKLKTENMTIEHLNKEWQRKSDELRAVVMPHKEFQKLLKERSKEEKEQHKQKDLSARKRIYVIDFEGDLAASQCSSLREQITLILALIRPDDKVIVRIESPGGMVHAYGLAASQIARLTSRKIHVTACVDKVAASGGYMMACVANKIVAAPFAMIGSIGAVSGMPNFNRFLKKHEIDYIEQTAGEYKRTISPFGEITEAGKAKNQEKLDQIHALFKNHVAEHRPQVDINSVSTGDFWPASVAHKMALVDELRTSDDLLLELGKETDIYQLTSEEPQDFRTRLMKKFFASASKLANEWSLL